MSSRYLLQKELQAYIQETIPAESMRNQLYQALSVPGKVLAKDFDPHGGWAVFCQTLAFEIASNGLTELQQQVVRRTALAVECLICALDIVDDLQDDDTSPLFEQLGIATNRSQALANAQNITLVLQMVITPGLLLSLHKVGVDSELLFKLMDTMNKAVLTAVQGQELDLAWEDFSLQQITQKHIATMMAYKSGSLMAMACAMSVIAAGITDSETVHRYMLFGTFLVCVRNCAMICVTCIIHRNQMCGAKRKHCQSSILKVSMKIWGKKVYRVGSCILIPPYQHSCPLSSRISNYPNRSNL
ncbi:polyprenyl synthetase family protein [Dictyobacter kobayashii]|uniref:polyprenyl synthetase family protein n=1 Tax=Dictyobacter kobayashii TaxID=2014872 RepID=UPI000F834944|nr:polyprenyl synthetase family protein [Dictyobacter kobayashii]